MGRRAASGRASHTSAVLALAVAGALWAALAISGVRRVIDDANVVPLPGFVPGAVDVLVGVVNGVRFVAPFVAVAALVSYVAFALIGRQSERGRVLNRLSRVEYAGIDHLDRDSGTRSPATRAVRDFFAGTGLAILAVVLVGATSGIESEVTNGPLRPVDALNDLFGHDDVSYVFQSRGITFMDDSAIPVEQMDRLVDASSVSVVPFGRHLSSTSTTSPPWRSRSPATSTRRSRASSSPWAARGGRSSSTTPWARRWARWSTSTGWRSRSPRLIVASRR